MFPFAVFKLGLLITNFSILALLVVRMIEHYKSNYNALSFSNIFHMLSFTWLCIRGCFWMLTAVSTSDWTAFSFYTLYWMPSPFQFCSFMLLPVYCAQILYPRQFTEYWLHIRFVYILVIVLLVAFQALWALLAALEKSQRQVDCSREDVGLQGYWCYHTEYSSDAFRAITAVCFLLLSAIQAVYAYKVYHLDQKIHERFLISSPKLLAGVNIVLFLSFLTRGMYQIGAIFFDYFLPDIPLQGTSDIKFQIFLAFVVWDYLPTILLVCTITSKSIGTSSSKRIYSMSQSE